MCAGQQGGQAVTIPIQVASELVYMEGRLNGSSRLSVVLDTGSSLTIVSPRIADALGLGSSGTLEATGIGKGTSQSTRLINDCELQWGSPNDQLRLVHQTAGVLATDYVSAQVGKRADAFFGSNLFKNYVITVDYAQQRATFLPIGTDAVAPGTPIPIRIANETPFVTAIIEGANGTKVTGLFLLDSGTSGALLLNRKFLDAHPDLLPAKDFVPAPSVSAVGGDIRLQLAQVPRLLLGPFSLSKIIALVPEGTTGVLADAEIAGFIGADVMRRFTVTWDYSHQRMYLLPNADLQKPFETDASGLHLTSPAPSYEAVTIDSVQPGSPAAQAGLRPGDEIRKIDGLIGLSVWRVAEALRKTGTSVELEVWRKSETLKVKLVLRSPFKR